MAVLEPRTGLQVQFGPGTDVQVFARPTGPFSLLLTSLEVPGDVCTTSWFNL